MFAREIGRKVVFLFSVKLAEIGSRVYALLSSFNHYIDSLVRHLALRTFLK